MDIPICFFSQQRKDTSHQKNNFCRLWRVGTLQKERDPGWLMTEPSCFTQWFALHYMFGTIPWNGSEEDDPKKKSPSNSRKLRRYPSQETSATAAFFTAPPKPPRLELEILTPTAKKMNSSSTPSLFRLQPLKISGGSVVSNPFIQTSKNLGKGSHNSLNLNSGAFWREISLPKNPPFGGIVSVASCWGASCWWFTPASEWDSNHLKGWAPENQL